MLLIDCDEESPTYRMIYKYSLFDVDYDVTITFYDSLDALIKTIIECYKEKAYFYDNDSPYKVVQMDSVKRVQISRKLNPNSGYWKLLE